MGNKVSAKKLEKQAITTKLEELEKQVKNQDKLLADAQLLRSTREDTINQEKLKMLENEKRDLELAMQLSLMDQIESHANLEAKLQEAQQMLQQQQAMFDTLQKTLSDVQKQLTEREKKEKLDELRRLQRILQVREKAKQSGIDCVNHFNIAVVGSSGTGKSSFFNAITGHKLDSTLGLAETTMKPEWRVLLGGNEHIRVWDIPGSGTARFRAKTYFEDQCLFCFDFLIVVVGKRLTESDVSLFNRAVHYKVNTVFVRSKSDQEVASAAEKMFEMPFNELESEEKQFVYDTVHKEIKTYFEDELARVGLGSVGHFFVSSMAIARNRPHCYPYFDESLLVTAFLDQCTRGKVRIINIDEIDVVPDLLHTDE